MKKYISVFFIFLFLSISISTVETIAASGPFSQGFYSLKDLNLMENTNYSAQNVSHNYNAYLIIFDDQERIQESVRLEPQSLKHTLLPLKSNYNILIVGKGELAFS
ncbi:hypothetical protein [uncultured Clostridium sp.]|uniref:hypothetical protein n=1 Tax=uncultured Clostridium sp. TaxID=59620 RepID=UPI0028E5432F|nr:hypothetical protein [uncultured Clostridium sp.]